MAAILGETVQTDWRRQLPIFHGREAVLRELRTSDAVSLYSLLTVEEVARVHFAAAHRRRVRSVHRLDRPSDGCGAPTPAPPTMFLIIPVF
jgi:hypothetical protein